MKGAQELFDDLQLSSSAHHDDDESCSTADEIMQSKLGSENHRREACCEQFDANKEIGKLISFFVIRKSQHASQARQARSISTNMPFVALPPPIKYSRASRKASSKPPA
jgi:hypothetical protein